MQLARRCIRTLAGALQLSLSQALAHTRIIYAGHTVKHNTFFRVIQGVWWILAVSWAWCDPLRGHSVYNRNNSVQA